MACNMRRSLVAEYDLLYYKFKPEQDHGKYVATINAKALISHDKDF